ncbi:MAG: leucine-rich repeat protein [Candidatus Methanoplasma sp.]|jgi:uncharacterized repeat protein (TIGR02543 family)|nr:leucine-rich repeat protein [Candidatus Methanoplasma sp.]
MNDEERGDGDRKRRAAILAIILLAAAAAIALALSSGGGGAGEPPIAEEEDEEEPPEALPGDHIVAFDSRGGSAVRSQTVREGSIAAEPAPPSRSGYSFEGWFREIECATEWDFMSDVVEEDLTLYAKWAAVSGTPRPPTYTATFDSRGGTPVPSAKGLARDSLVPAPQSPEREGYSFDGWFKDAECSREWDFSADTVTSNVTLYAKWEGKEYTITLRFPTASVEGAPQTMGVRMGQEYSIPDPARAPYRFGGWFLKEGGVNYAVGSEDGANVARQPQSGVWSNPGDLTLYAYWEGTMFLKYEGGAAYKGTASTTGSVVIQEYYLGRKISSIGADAFSGCANMTSIDAPGSIASVGARAFSYCYRLESISLPGAAVIGDEAFLSCSALGSASIPGATSLGARAFASCASLSEMSLPNANTIGERAFTDCSGLKSVSMPKATVIGAWAFAKSGLESVSIPSGATAVAERCFSECASLRSVSLPSSLKSIGSYAFYMTGLTGVSIPSGVEVIGDNAFFECAQMTAPLSIPSSVASIGVRAFGKTGITSLSFAAGSNLTTLGAGAFIYCTALSGTVSLPSSVTSIGNGAFQNDINLSEVIIPAREMSFVGPGVFQDCSIRMVIKTGTADPGAGSAPPNWAPNWNNTRCTVIWGYVEP